MRIYDDKSGAGRRDVNVGCCQETNGGYFECAPRRPAPAAARSSLTAGLPSRRWAVRSSIASVLSSLLVLSPGSPAVLSYNVWLTVLAVVCAKPTLGDGIKTWWWVQL